MTRMQPHSEALGVIARELAFDVAASSFSPDEVRHIPGITNKAEDYLSRLKAPGPPACPPTYYRPRLAIRASPGRIVGGTPDPLTAD